MDEEEKYMRDIDDCEEADASIEDTDDNFASESGSGDRYDHKSENDNLGEKNTKPQKKQKTDKKEKKTAAVAISPAAIYRMIMLALTAIILVIVICILVKIGQINKEGDVEVLNETDNQLMSDTEDDVSNGVLDMGEINDGNLTLTDVQAMDSNDIIDTYLISKTNAKKNNYKSNGFVKDDMFMYYEEDGERISKIGVDVSSYQGDIDWRKVKQAGIDFAIVRIGIRGYGSGKLVADDKFEENIEGALAEGLEVGAYFFSQAITEEEAVEEAEFVYKAIKDYDITLPVGYDTEKITVASARTNRANISSTDRTKMAIAFCDYLNEKGYKTAIYSNKRWFLRYLNLEMLDDYNIWLAQYSKEVSFPFHFSMWQYTDSGKVDGIDGNVDLDIYIPGKE